MENWFNGVAASLVRAVSACFFFQLTIVTAVEGL
jgi:hypothetical protein